MRSHWQAQATGWLLKNDMRAGLRKSFKNKTEQQLLELFDALDNDEPRELVNYYRCGGAVRIRHSKGLPGSTVVWLLGIPNKSWGCAGSRHAAWRMRL